MEKLNSTQIKNALSSVPNWKQDDSEINRTFQFKDFSEAMKFVNGVAKLAEAAQHHPDIDIRWNKVRLALSTHDAGGLTANDFDLAEKINKL
jgi:4a-hydroxytetrahydrobiopterin dehydratase